ncbi:hypothetical protein Tco_1101387 [Tanacetum coccineum]
MKDMGKADVILGIRIKHESNVISIPQSHYIEKVLKKFYYFDYTQVSTLMDTSEKLRPNNGHVVSQLEYSWLIGCLIDVALDFLLDLVADLTVADVPEVVPVVKLLIVIEHVKEEKDQLKNGLDWVETGLEFSRYHTVLEGYADASWINNAKDNSSTSSWVFLLEGGTISWVSKKQTCITSSLMESEFVALAATRT